MDIIVGILAIIAAVIAIAVGGTVIFILLSFSITIVGWYFVLPDLWRAGHDNLAALLAVGAPIVNIRKGSESFFNRAIVACGWITKPLACRPIR